MRANRVLLMQALVIAYSMTRLAGPAGGQTLRLDLPSQYIPGYSQSLKGEELQYHSPVPRVDRSLLVRSLDRRRSIAWETGVVPDDFEGDTAVFVMMAAIDVTDEPRRFDLLVGGQPLLQFENPTRDDRATIDWTGERGVRAQFRVALIDKYGDAMGFIFLKAPRELWGASGSLSLEVVGESAGRQTWFMIFKEPIKTEVTLRNAPVLLQGREGREQMVRVDLLYLGDSGRFRMASSQAQLEATLSLGLNRFEIPVPEVEKESKTALSLEVDDYRADTVFSVLPVRPMTLHLIHHTHLDIGYTHHQSEVERLQWEHLENALRYGAASEGYPDGARFVWNPEGLWAVESYLERHDQVKQERLVEGIRRGWIELDGLFANLLTGLTSSEGLMRGLQSARRLSARAGVRIESAMLSDIPGFTWGLVPVLAQNGIKYLSIGPNFGHRIGHFLEEWGDRPFYWESPSGRERVLTWVSGAGYASFHTGLGYSRLTKRLDEETIFRYLDRLTEQGYPYELNHLRYNIGSDNGPPDPGLAEAVRAWNQRYVAPRLIISTNTDFFEAFESRYGDRLPVHRGDLTGYWEDGASSSARETAVVRRTAESLVQTEALAAMLAVTLPDNDLYQAWRSVLLFYEHTWGSWNSISEPESEFTRRQWLSKKAFADSAEARARRLRAFVLADRVEDNGGTHLFEVLNASSWPRTDVVVVPAAATAQAGRVIDASGQTVLSQRLRTGELAFLAEDVPAFGAKRFVFLEGGPAGRATRSSGSEISNGSMSLQIDTLVGTIRSLKFHGQELVDPGSAGLNRYIYVASRSPADTATNGPVDVSVIERGPLVWAIRVEAAAAPGTRSGIRSDVRLYRGSDRVEIKNSMDKALVYSSEAVLYEFPFNLQEPRVRVDVPWGSYQPETEQLPGSSKNYLSLQRWVDIQGRDAGVALVSIDVPMIQLGEIATDAIVVGWREDVQPSARLYSYAMNNYWETNYRAGQEGAHEFSYSLHPHLAFEESEIERFSLGIGQPLLAIPVSTSTPALEPPFVLSARRTVATLLRRESEDGGLILRLYNPGPLADKVNFDWASGKSVAVYRASAWGEAKERLGDSLELGPYEIITLLVIAD
ncbi:MAG: hypothetical protein JSU87_05580 [Gemmatimonadota bacterium]|nr:MAG: hypothetical protein JSU87_05580 [Gemmatimonadota bacterium]